MIQHAVKEIGGIGVFGVISICLFVTVFTGALIWAAVQKKSFLNNMSTLPLEDSTPAANPKGDISHE